MEAEDQLLSAVALLDIIYSVAIASCFFIHYKMQVRYSIIGNQELLKLHKAFSKISQN